MALVALLCLQAKGPYGILSPPTVHSSASVDSVSLQCSAVSLMTSSRLYTKS